MVGAEEYRDLFDNIPENRPVTREVIKRMIAAVESGKVPVDVEYVGVVMVQAINSLEKRVNELTSSS